jgi:predicted MFS family arabinose efflux permease
MTANVKQHHWELITLAAAAMLMVMTGARQSMGLFVAPMNTSTGLGIATISFAMAVNQFIWGAVQPFTGAFADRYGAGRVLVAGLLIFVLSSMLTPEVTTSLGLVLTMGLLSAVGAGAVSFSVLIGAVSRRVPVRHRGTAAGIINAGSSFGQFVFAPLLQTLISVFGWMNAMWSLAFITLATLPLARFMRGSQTSAVAMVGAAGGPWTAVKDALADRSYLLLHAGFFTCGFHIAFLVTHLPGEVDLCGLPASVASWSLAIIGIANILGSLGAGWCVNRYQSKYVLFWMYGSRALLVLLYLAAPKTVWTFYLFAAGLGFTWLATVPPTAGVIGKLFGTHYLATLFGLTLLSHQTGGFFGAWLGGIAITQSGDYVWMWYVDALLAATAAFCNLPIREPRVERHAVPA